MVDVVWNVSHHVGMVQCGGDELALKKKIKYFARVTQIFIVVFYDKPLFYHEMLVYSERNTGYCEKHF